MRLACLASLLTALFALTANAFEIEEQLAYPATSETSRLAVLSTADRSAFEPIIHAFQAQNPGVAIDYTVAGTRDVMQAINDEGAVFDLVISSAMDLQTKLANDGLAQTYRSNATDALPAWAAWRDQLFAFTQEPAVLVLSDKHFTDGTLPSTREELIALLRDEPDRFKGRIGTYDVRRSGFGYLMATQDARIGEAFWRLTEVMGRLDTRLYCCSSDMIAAVRSGDLAVAYNVLGSYAAGELERSPGFTIVEMADYTNVMLRTALIPVTAENTDDARRMIDFLVTLNLKPELVAETGLPAVDEAQMQANTALRPIRLGPELLVFLDRLKRRNFLRVWESSIQQE